MKQETIEVDKLAPVTNPVWGRIPYQRVDAARYVSPEHARLELERLWPFAWQVACREEEVANPGDYFEYELGDHSILVVRTDTGDIKGYFNACLHRGTQLAKGCGHLKQLTCPFHGWRWSLDGECRFVLDRADFPGLNYDELRLPQCQVGRWGGFVFVKLTEGGPSLEKYLSPVPEHLAMYRLEDYRICFWKSAVVRCNWKVALEAFEEVYHTMKTHPQVLRGMDEVNTSYETFGAHSRMIVDTGVANPRFGGSVKEQDVLKITLGGLLDFGLASETEREMLEALGNKPLPEGATTRSLFQAMGHEQYGRFMPDLPKERYLQVYHYTLFPNITFNMMPGNFLGLLARPNGTDPDTCVFDAICLVHPCGQTRAPAKREFVTDPDYDWGRVMEQDLSNMERVQKGMHQRTFKQTRLAGYQEQRIHNRLTHIDKYYAQYKA